MDFSIIKEIIVDWVNWFEQIFHFNTSTFVFEARLHNSGIIYEDGKRRFSLLWLENLRYFSLTSIIHASNRLN